MALASTVRFSDRVDDYVKYRPGYPDALLAFCREAMGTTPAWTVADLGAGTG
ncbi:MAG TPA: SAM-dependent methyltransferase, partial [bacterium]